MRDAASQPAAVPPVPDPADHVAERRKHVEADAPIVAAFDEATVGMAVLDERGEWLRINRALCDLLGYDESELLRRGRLALTHPTDRAEDRRRLTPLLDGWIDRVRTNHRFIDAHGEHVPVRAVATAVPGADGRARLVLMQVVRRPDAHSWTSGSAARLPAPPTSAEPAAGMGLPPVAPRLFDVEPDLLEAPPTTPPQWRSEQTSLESDLRRALRRDELKIVYQPTVALNTGTLQGVEALIRWQHPELGLLAPASFLTIAERSGLIDELGLWVLLEACRQASVWRRAGRNLTMAINLSAHQLDRGGADGGSGFAASVERALATYELPPAALRFELTESVLLEATGRGAEDLVALAALGVSLGIDDFGTGYSSMTYLKRLPVDVIKIDRSFVAGLEHDPADTAIVEATLALGRSLGLTVVAEGVEQRTQARRLVELGCPLAQGFLFGRPQKAATAISRSMQPVG